ncbi:YidH family protein [Flavobacterium psychrotrophum]|uniref:YidH family protein n=1 Tax=Flavobacterium psychrotrophum TaxID=2294119 RepID=UPI000E30E778|nr:DUF202 domain-containing protein [Flavobacterium psychrotrophum]
MEHLNDRELVREHLANERTYLAWTRTGIGIMAFGFVVVKFSLFIKQIALGFNTDNPVHNKGYSSLIGISLVIVGIMITVLAFVRYRRNILLIRNHSFSYSSTLASILALIIAIAGCVVVAYLLETAR